MLSFFVFGLATYNLKFSGNFLAYIPSLREGAYHTTLKTGGEGEGGK
jgi:hypothetical protein